MAGAWRHLRPSQALGLRSRLPVSFTALPCTGAHSASLASASRPSLSSFGASRPSYLAHWMPGGCRRHLAAEAAAPRLSQEAAKALGSIKDTMKAQQKVSQVTLSKAAKRSFPGNIRRYKLMGGRDEFHNVDRNKHGRIFEPWHNFEIVISSSKNNCWITVKNKGWKYRTVFASHAGNVGYRAAAKKSEAATYAIALNIGRKLKRLGVTCAEVTFRRIMKVEPCLQAFQSVGLQVTRLTHQPRLPHGDPTKPRKQRRV
eukprot:TRINITY_DN91920_c0_g1_i1.p1 TRINITY_DN91920_c0_g1~~TRINITY_DN91920_c0_g1_i1.p1  ORF type:complete len:280 (+),score=41.35 TRINITY_DN91920_c0_g1_i1:69-842(+)